MWKISGEQSILRLVLSFWRWSEWEVGLVWFKEPRNRCCVTYVRPWKFLAFEHHRSHHPRTAGIVLSLDGHIVAGASYYSRHATPALRALSRWVPPWPLLRRVSRGTPHHTHTDHGCCQRQRARRYDRQVSFPVLVTIKSIVQGPAVSRSTTDSLYCHFSWPGVVTRLSIFSDRMLE